MKKYIILLFAFLLSFGLTMNCQDVVQNTDMAKLTVKLVDAPIVLDNGLTVEQVNVVITRVDVVRNGSCEENSEEIKSGDGIYTILETDMSLNILDYNEGIQALLGSVELEPGDYLQLRLIVEADSSTIKFEGDDTLYSLKVPDGDVSGIKIKGNARNPLFIITEGEEAEIVIDFDAQMSILIHENKDGYIIRPVIKEVKYKNQVVAFKQEGPGPKAVEGPATGQQE